MRRHPITPSVLMRAVALTAALAAFPASAETYKWTDADGKVHYSDQPPPPNVKQQTTVTPRKSTAPGATAPTKTDAQPAKAKTYVEQEAEFRKRQVESAEREAADKKKADEIAERKRNCEQVRVQLKGLQAGGRVTQTNAQGEREYMSDAQIAQEIDRLKKAETGLCK